MYDGDGRSAQEFVDRLADAAERFETPCGAGEMVRRAWGSGPPLVLLHGAHGSWTHWIRNIEALSAARRVIVADLPGFGDSALPPQGDGAGLTEALASGLRRLPVETPADLVGFSTGGVVGASLAAHAPDLVRRLVLVDAGGLGTPLGQFSTRPVRGLEGEALRQAHRDNLLSLMLRHEATVDELALLIQGRNVSRARLSPSSLVLPDKLLSALAQVRAPIDLIWADEDAAHPYPASQAAVVRRFQPGAGLRVIAGAGHWVMYERSEAFNEALLAVLAEPPRRTPGLIGA